MFSLSIKKCEISIILFSLENMADSAYEYIPKYAQKNLHLEEIKTVHHRPAKLNVQGPAIGSSHRSRRTHRRLKKFSMAAGINTGWYFLYFERLKRIKTLGFLKIQRKAVNQD